MTNRARLRPPLPASPWGLSALAFLCSSCLGQVTPLHSFNPDDTPLDAFPTCTLTEVQPDVFMGTASDTIFRVTSSGAFEGLASFNPNTQGGYAVGQLFPASNGLFYGVNDSGNGSYHGSIFVTSASGQFTILKSDTLFATPLFEASDGNLYGIAGDAVSGSYYVYRMTTTGEFTALHNLGLNGQATAPLFEATDGNLYGMTGGANGSQGILFRMSLSGEFTTLYEFPAGEGADGGFMQASNGLLYGSAAYYTDPECGRYGGFIFSLSLSGQLTKYEEFGGCIVGDGPLTGLIEGSDGNLYGATADGGPQSDGTLFKMALDGSSFETLITFDEALGTGPGGVAGAGLVQGSDGAFYSVAYSGGEYGAGNVFRAASFLPPPLPTASYARPSSAAPGTSVIINGQHLVGVTGVSFNGVASTSITSRAPYFVIAVVPPGATSGPITITTPNGSVTSKFTFTVN